ncbi:hypothetical protein [Aeromicrobium sp. Sec7.5]|uniref:hypothetical protein n=1 Tax=Aeromicrobium sp. Sec7.5 TaxID=3121276 RepID=UPI002FE47146
MILLAALLVLSFLAVAGVVLLLVRGDGLGHLAPPRSHAADEFAAGRSAQH